MESLDAIRFMWYDSIEISKGIIHGDETFRLFQEPVFKNNKKLSHTNMQLGGRLAPPDRHVISGIRVATSIPTTMVSKWNIYRFWNATYLALIIGYKRYYETPLAMIGMPMFVRYPKEMYKRDKLTRMLGPYSISLDTCTLVLPSDLPFCVEINVSSGVKLKGAPFRFYVGLDGELERSVQ